MKDNSAFSTRTRCYKNIAIKKLVLNTANFWQDRYTFGYQNCIGAVHFWRPKVYRGGTNLVTKNVPPGTIFARYNFCVTVLSPCLCLALCSTISRPGSRPQRAPDGHQVVARAKHLTWLTSLCIVSRTSLGSPRPPCSNM